ncbi:MAG: helix-turn-helix domain-containing protein [Bacteroidetes bacterium]|nr:helix-turn-helix domain-containing protein [Bacteroidota bacterium]
MSYVGKNIKKIRSVKNLNQSDFADLFELKRASIGAYEEGRAEPKIATLIEIAKHFGISTDDLLNKELSVNDLFHFDIFKKDYVKNAANQLRPTKMPQSFAPVWFISSEKRNDYFNGLELDQFLKLNLPLPGIKSDYLSFEPHAGMPWINEEGRALELLIVRELKDPKDWPVALYKKVLLWDEGQFHIGKLESKDKKPGLLDFRHSEFRPLQAKSHRLFLVLYELANVLSK